MLGVSVQNSTQLGESTDSLRPFIWSRAFSLMQFRDGSDKKQHGDPESD
jgi:hypothetical protein